MEKKEVMEVMTPLLRFFTGSDPHIDSFQVGKRYLQTSPELGMKILLGSGSGDIYQLSPVFRDEPIEGPYHQSEFLMLEWYRVGLDEKQLSAEVIELLNFLGVKDLPVIHNLREIFQSFYAQDLWTMDHQELFVLARAYMDLSTDLEAQDYVDLLIDHMVRSINLPLLVLQGFPKSMQLMARFDQESDQARRFEVYYHGHELANGFYELNDSKIQKERMEQDNKVRKQFGKPEIPLDEQFLSAVGRMPSCSGVALGLDRLIWLMLDQS
jgi:lysyl-tRNA synthetase class 2